MLIHYFCIQISFLLSPLLLFFSLSGSDRGAPAEAMVDGDGRCSPGNGGLCIRCLPALSHHHLLQGHQEVGCHFYAFRFL